MNINHCYIDKIFDYKLGNSEKDGAFIDCMVYTEDGYVRKRLCDFIDLQKDSDGRLSEIDDGYIVDMTVDVGNIDVTDFTWPNKNNDVNTLLKWQLFTQRITSLYGLAIATEMLRAQQERWSDWLWLGRHLFLREHRDTLDEIAIRADEAEKRIVEKYKKDPEFIKLMTDVELPTVEKLWFYGEDDSDIKWNIINSNVGALRKILWNDWFLDS